MHLTTTGTDRQGAFRRGHCNRFAKLRVLLLASAVCLFACCAKEDQQEAEMRRIEREIEAKIAGVPKAMERGGLREYGLSISDTINCLPDEKQRIEWCKKAIYSVYEVDIGHLEYDRQYGNIADVDNYVRAVCRAWSRKHKSLEEGWKRWLFSLGWKQKQLTRLKKEYAAIKPKTFAKPIPESVFNKFWALKGLIKSLTGDLEDEATRYERWYWKDRFKGKLSLEVSTEVKQKLETLLGRPIRTLDQIEADRQRKAEAFRRAEEAAQSGTNRPPPLILIDGDL